MIQHAITPTMDQMVTLCKRLSDALAETREERDELLEAFRHTHKARRIVSGPMKGQLTDACADCGLDIRHDIHPKVTVTK